ncbi:MAG: hypothetical protein H6696_04455 [Deferribacteres bacterium]|nr:hypothetical protein [candidate division KSB1 bacterium]MCB9501167.1 hypothetical protein [Deferribacteres bacterium]
MDISIHENTSDTHHPCKSIRNGDWIVFTCPLCPDYERRVNWRTKELTVKGSKAEIQHSGDYIPDEYKHAFTAMN